MESVEIKDQNHALQVLINFVKVAVKRGAYELEEVEVAIKAIKLFTSNIVQGVEREVEKVLDIKE